MEKENKMDCDCGSRYINTLASYKRHIKTRKHKRHVRNVRIIDLPQNYYGGGSLYDIAYDPNVELNNGSRVDCESYHIKSGLKVTS